MGGEGVEVVLEGPDVQVSVTSRYSRVVTRAHPGVQAPLGWTLSQSSIDDLRDQLAIPENRVALAEVRAWLDGEMSCVGN